MTQDLYVDEGVLFRKVRCLDESEHVFVVEFDFEKTPILLPKIAMHPESGRPVPGEAGPILLQTWYAEWRGLCR